MINKNIFLISLLAFFRRAPLFITYFYFPLIFLDFGFNGWQIGILFSLFTITALLFTLPTGITNDIFSIKKLIIIGFLILFSFYFSLSLTQNFWIYLILFFIGGLGVNITETSLNSLILKIKTNTPGKKLGIYYTFAQFGIVIGTLIGGFLLTTFNVAIVFRNISYFFLILVLISFFIPKTKTIKFEFLHYKKDILKKSVLLFVFVLFLLSLHWGAEAVALSPFLETKLGLTKIGIGIYMALSVLIMCIAAYIIGIKIDKNLDTKKALYVGLILSGIGHILMTYPNYFFSIFWRFIHEIGDAIVGIIMLIGITRLFNIDRIGGSASFVVTVMTMGMFFGSLIFSQIGYKLGYHIPLIFSGILTLTAFLLALYQRKSMYH